MSLLNSLFGAKCVECRQKIKGEKFPALSSGWSCQACHTRLEEERKKKEEEQKHIEEKRKRKKEEELKLAQQEGERRANFKMLCLAVEEGNLQDVRSLLDRGGDANTVNHEAARECVLHNAACTEHVAVGKLLLDHGAKVDARDYHHQTPLHWIGARKFSKVCLDMAEFLIESGADVNAKDHNSLTPLHTASLNGHLALVKLLLSKGSDPHAKSKRGRTPFYYAVEGGHDEIEKTLGEITGETSIEILAIVTHELELEDAIGKPIIRIEDKEAAREILSDERISFMLMMSGYQVQERYDGLVTLAKLD